MNIFVTNVNPKQCAIEHNDVHLRKMIVETAQLLSTCHSVLDGNIVAYKKTHENHPCNKWLRKDPKNYAWTWYLLRELCREYYYRADKHHKTSMYINRLEQIPDNLLTDSLNDKNWVTVLYPTINDLVKDFDERSFVCAMPECFITDNTFESYQEYLSIKYEEWKQRWVHQYGSTYFKPIKVEWTKRDTPSWYIPTNIEVCRHPV